MISGQLEPGHIVGVWRRGCTSRVCRSVGMTGHPAHSPCALQDCLNYRGTWHGSEHLIPCRGCGACLGVAREDYDAGPYWGNSGGTGEG